VIRYATVMLPVTVAARQKVSITVFPTVLHSDSDTPTHLRLYHCAYHSSSSKLRTEGL
jgi:hypothetical protein